MRAVFTFVQTGEFDGMLDDPAHGVGVQLVIPNLVVLVDAAE